jgi:hypothetical protein
MTLLFQLRLVVYLRRLVRAAESIAQSQRTLASLAQQSSLPRPKAAKAEFSMLNVAELNKEYHRQRVEEGIEEE